MQSYKARVSFCLRVAPVPWPCSTLSVTADPTVVRCSPLGVCPPPGLPALPLWGDRRVLGRTATPLGEDSLQVRQ